MNDKSAMSAIGYAIISVILLGIIMIVSAPMLVNNTKEEKVPEPVNNFKTDDYSELKIVEERLTSRIEALENKQPTQQTITDKYVCSIEGKLNEEGDVVPVDSAESSSKFVFVCEYKR